MVTQYLRPGIYVEEVDATDRAIAGAGVATPIFFGIADRGPISTPVLVTGKKDFERVFGYLVQDESLHPSVMGFFANGGSACYVVRLSHYSDITDYSANSGIPSYSAMLSDNYATAEPAQFTGAGDVTTFATDNGHDLVFDINNIGNATATITAAVGVKQSSVAGTYATGTATTTCVMNIDGSGDVAIDLNGITSGIASYKTEIQSRIDAALGGGKAVVTDSAGGGTLLSIEGVIKGTSGNVTIQSSPGGDWDALTKLGVGASAGSGNVANSLVATFAELKTIVEAATTGLTLSQEAITGKLMLTTATTGAAAEIDLVSGNATLMSNLALGDLGTQGGGDAAIGSDTVGGAAAIMVAGYRGRTSPGTFGNYLTFERTFDPLHPSLGASLDLAVDASSSADSVRLTNTTGLSVHSILKFEEASKVDYAVVTAVEAVVVGSAVQYTVTLEDGLSNSYTAALATVTSLEFSLAIENTFTGESETWSQLSMNQNADNYAGTRINDSEIGSSLIYFNDSGATFPANQLPDETLEAELAGGTSERTGFVVADILGDSAAKTGLYAADEATGASMLLLPPGWGSTSVIPATAVVHLAMDAYARGRLNMLPLLDVPLTAAFSATQAVAYRSSTLGFNSRHSAMYFPYLKQKVTLPTSVVAEVYLPPSGFVAGVYARVSGLPSPDGGPAATPAGIGDYGRVRGTTGVGVSIIAPAELEALNVASVNVIVPTERDGICIMGGRVLTPEIPWRYVSVRRTFNYVSASIAEGTRWAVFRNNDENLWKSLRTNIGTFLRGMHSAGQLAGTKASDAFFIKLDASTTTASDVAEGRLIMEIGIAPQRPAEFVIFRISQFQGGTTVTA